MEAMPQSHSHSRTTPPPAVSSAPPQRVLFLCVHNSARSQMAEGLARAMAPTGVTVWSAGSDPCGVNPHAVQALEEIGVDIRSQTSKHVDDVPWREADTVVTLCAEELCPVVASNVRRLHWPLPDPGHAPESEQLEAFRRVRDEIRWRLTSLWPRSG
jgi:arsenate reductase (thioredoxin)